MNCFSHRTPLSPDEQAIAASLIEEDPYMARVLAERQRIRKLIVAQERAVRLRNRGYAPGPFIRFADREAAIKGE